MADPIIKFTSWWQAACENSPLKQKNAVCVSTINQDGFPEGRFVDLKAVNEQGFVFCTYLNSNKGEHIQNNSKVAMTFWWDHVGLQVRVVGHAEPLCEQVACEYWQARNKEAQITTLCSEQSKALASELQLLDAFKKMSAKLASEVVAKPDNWGGYVLKPVSMEFLTFRENRLHLRELFKTDGKQGRMSLLQP